MKNWRRRAAKKRRVIMDRCEGGFNSEWLRRKCGELMNVLFGRYLTESEGLRSFIEAYHGFPPIDRDAPVNTYWRAGRNATGGPLVSFADIMRDAVYVNEPGPWAACVDGVWIAGDSSKPVPRASVAGVFKAETEAILAQHHHALMGFE